MVFGSLCFITPDIHALSPGCRFLGEKAHFTPARFVHSYCIHKRSNYEQIRFKRTITTGSELLERYRNLHSSLNTEAYEIISLCACVYYLNIELVD